MQFSKTNLNLLPYTLEQDCESITWGRIMKTCLNNCALDHLLNSWFNSTLHVHVWVSVISRLFYASNTCLKHLYNIILEQNISCNTLMKDIINWFFRLFSKLFWVWRKHVSKLNFIVFYYIYNCNYCLLIFWTLQHAIQQVECNEATYMKTNNLLVYH